MTRQNDKPARLETCFASQDNLALDQLRLENLWLRQRLHALSKLDHEWRRGRVARRVDERSVAA